MKLVEVREMKCRIEELERRRENLREVMELVGEIVPGLKCKVAAEIEQSEIELENLRGEQEIKAAKLAAEIMARVATPARRAVLIKRYVQCKTMKEIARESGFCLRHLYRLSVSGAADFDSVDGI